MTLNRIARNALALLAAAALVGLSSARLAMAQTSIPDAVISSSPVSDDGKAEIKRYIEANSPGLTGEVGAIRRSKNALSAPLISTSMSESFRREYSTQLVPVVAPLVVSEKEEVAINAVRLAGLLGTKQGMDEVIRALGDKRASVRMMAAMSLGLSISTSRAANSHALTVSNVGDALDALNAKMATEQNASVVDAMMLALDDATKVMEENLPDARKKAIGYVLSNLQRLAGQPRPPAFDQVFAHGVKTLGEALIVGGPDKLSGATVQSAACVAGDVVAVVIRRMEATPTEAERSQLGLIALQCERIVQQGAEGLNAKRPAYNLDELIHENKDAEFVQAAQKMFQTLSADPFGCKPANRYPAAP